MTDQSQPLPVPPSRHHISHIFRRTLSKSWDDSIFSESAQAAFWCALSLPPLLLGMLGSLAYLAPLFGPDTLPTIENQLIGTSERFFSQNVVNEIIAPTIYDIVAGARGEVVSLGFVISLWAGSSAVSAFVDAGVEAPGPNEVRPSVRQRFSALDIFLVMLCRWTRAMAQPATSYRHINRLIGLVTARPAWTAMMQAEGIDWNGPLAS